MYYLHDEENGLRGGTKYADEAKAKNEKHIFALESDAGGFTPRGFSFDEAHEQLIESSKLDPSIAALWSIRN